ncbi:MAG: nickel pincer cofactor biosynthesis protein LarC [Candidatus Hodarchaeales archaeon]
MSLLLFDPRTSGAAGDLLIAALLDTQQKEYHDDFCNLFQKLLTNYDPDFKVACSTTKRQGVTGIIVQTSAKKKFPPSEMQKIISKLGNQLNFSSKAMELISKAIFYLIKAEMKVHGYDSDSEELHFHELATTDTMFDIVGFAYLLEKLNLLEMDMKILPIAVGGGTIKIAHGEVSIPAPATSEIIREGKLQIVGGPIEGELLTPTGAALLASLNATAITHYPLIQMQKIGRSFGTRKTDQKFLSSLQIIQGSSPFSLEKEEITVLETNVDDVDGETLGYLFDILYEKNLVLDLTIISTISKKNRPGYLIHSIVEPSKAIDVIKILSRELGTLGVRVYSGFRHIIPRKIKTYQIDIKSGLEPVQYKQGFIDSEIISEKIEFEDLKRLAQKEGITLKEMRKKIFSEIEKQDDSNA